MRALLAATVALGPLLVAGTVSLGCPQPGAVAKAVRPQPSVTMPGEARCGIAQGHAEPLVVEWPASVRAKLEALTRKGLVAVRWEGCELEVLASCKVPGAYAWTPITRKDDRVSMRDQDELWANVPIGAGGLEGKLSRSGALHVRMTIVGRWQADRDVVRANELDGDCVRATHVVTAMAAGAFDFWAGAEAAVAGGATIASYGAGAKSASSAELINRDGDVAACAKSSLVDTTPPEGCGALLRIELSKVGAARQEIAHECTGKTAWDGNQCAALVVGSGLECPAGFVVVANECRKPAGSSSASSSSSSSAPAAPSPAAAPICAYGDAVECTRSCELHADAASCNDLALMLSRGEGVTADEKKATSFYMRACDLGSAIGCNNAGMRLEYGRGTSKDEASAATLYAKACDAGWPGACNNLGRMVINGWGVPKDEPRAVDLFRKGCGQGEIGACANLGWCYVRGRGVLGDQSVGVGFLKKACGGGNGWACDRLAALGVKP